MCHQETYFVLTPLRLCCMNKTDMTYSRLKMASFLLNIQTALKSNPLVSLALGSRSLPDSRENGVQLMEPVLLNCQNSIDDKGKEISRKEYL